MRDHQTPTWHYILLALIILTSFFVRIYIVDFQREVASSDEGEYLIMAKSFAEGTIISQWPYYRPYLVPYFWSILLRLGLDIPAFYITLIICSLASIFLLYLIGKNLFSSGTGLIAALLFAFLPEEILYNSQLLLNSLAITFWLLSLYLFITYSATRSQTYLYLCSIATGIAILAYTQNLPLLGIYLVFLLCTEGAAFFQQKKYLLFFAIPILFYCINFLYSWIWFGNPLTMAGYGLWLSHTDTQSRTIITLVLAFIRHLPTYFTWFALPFLLASILFFVKPLQRIATSLLRAKKELLKPLVIALPLALFYFGMRYFLMTRATTPTRIVLIYGITTLLTVLLGLSLLFLFRTSFTRIAPLFQKRTATFFLLLWISIGFFGTAMMVGSFQARYFLPILPAFLLLFAHNITQPPIRFLSKKALSFLSTFLIILVLLSQFFTLTTMRIPEEQGLRAAGIWLATHTQPSDTIIGSSNPALAYYSNRHWTKYPPSTTFTHATYEGLLNYIRTRQPRYLVLYYQTPADIQAHALYFQFLQKNPLTPRYTEQTTDGTTIEIYTINYSHPLQ